MRRLLAAFLVVAFVLVSCGGDDPEANGNGDPVPATVTGDIVEITPEEGQVESFVLESGEGRFELRIANDVDYGFDLSHLREHMAATDPVVVTTEERSDGAYALTIEDV